MVVRRAKHRLAKPLHFALALRTWESLLESYSAGTGSPLKIDHDAKIIYGVKVLGRRSPNAHGVRDAVNGTEYSVAAMESAIPLYENATIKANHPPRDKPYIERSIDDTLGVLRNVRLEEDGLRGDLHLYKTHEMTERVIEDVERRFGKFGLSHNAFGEGDVKNGTYIIERITEVRSVDLVDKPATTTNLWESQHMAKKSTTLRAFLEGLAPKLDTLKKAKVRKILEWDDGQMGAQSAMELDDPANGDNPDDALWTGFSAAIQKILDKYKDGSCEPADAIKQIGKMIKTHDSLSDDDTPAEDLEESECDDDDMKDKKDMKESLEQLQRKDKCRDLCESLAFVPSKEQIAVLMELSSDAARKTTAESFKAARGGSGRPKSQGQGAGTGATHVQEGMQPPSDPKALAAWLRG